MILILHVFQPMNVENVWLKSICICCYRLSAIRGAKLGPAHLSMDLVRILLSIGLGLDRALARRPAELAVE